MATALRQKFYDSLRLPAIAVVVLWVIQGIQVLLNLPLGQWGIYPRTIFGLRGIFFSPLIHGSWGHLLSNTPPLFVLSAMILFFYRRVAFSAISLIYFFTGVAVWVFGRSVFHIGASGVIYGLVAFVFWTGIFRRNIKSIALGLIVAFYYGSMLLGILPGKEGISWESHLIGGIVGILVAFLLKGRLEEDERPQRPSWELEPGDQNPTYFLDRETFTQTREERRRAELLRRQEDQDPDRTNRSGWSSDKTW